MEGMWLENRSGSTAAWVGASLCFTRVQLAHDRLCTAVGVRIGPCRRPGKQDFSILSNPDTKQVRLSCLVTVRMCTRGLSELAGFDLKKSCLGFVVAVKTERRDL